jgi:hypothetical protein
LAGILGVCNAAGAHASYGQTLLEDISLITSKLLGCMEPIDVNSF